MLGKEGDQAGSPKWPFLQVLLPRTLSLRPLGRSNHPFSLRSEGLLLLKDLGCYRVTNNTLCVCVMHFLIQGLPPTSHGPSVGNVISPTPDTGEA